MTLQYFAANLVNKTELTNVPQGDLTGGSVQAGLQIVFGVAGGIALLIGAIAALKYVMSQGNPQETTKAKNTLMYAIIGLAITILSYSIIFFVLDRL